MQGLVGDQQKTLILPHHTPPFDSGHSADMFSRLRSITWCGLIYIKHTQTSAAGTAV